MSICVFCGDKGSSAEHIVAQWLIKRMGVKKSHTITVSSKDGLGNETKRPAHNLLKYTTKNVCEKCNNGWMSSLENWFKYNMGFFVEPTWPILAEDHIRAALPTTSDLAAWCLKTAVVMSNNSSYRTIHDGEMIKGLRLGYVVNDVYVDMARIETPDVSHIMSKGFRIGNGSPVAKWFSRKDDRAYTCIIQLNHLALRVYRCPGADPFYRSIRKRIPYRLFPSTPVDPHTIDYRFDTLLDFEDALVLKTITKSDDWNLPATELQKS
jgi:hypothetical protein